MEIKFTQVDNISKQSHTDFLSTDNTLLHKHFIPFSQSHYSLAEGGHKRGQQNVPKADESYLDVTPVYVRSPLEGVEHMKVFIVP